MRHPYIGLPKQQFWRSGVTEAGDIDPFIPGPAHRILSQSDKIATAGSCFAQHIGRALSESGLKLMDVERPSASMSEREAREANYGVFSGRYGNIYTARQLLQLFQRADGSFIPDEDLWEGLSGWVDPFRPNIEPSGFKTIAELKHDRCSHLLAVRNMFETVDVFIFTLGLTEAWASKSDGAVFPLAPGVSGGNWSPANYEFVNFNFAEVVADLLGFLDRLALVNRSARVILTVSPIPLVATYEPKHVLTSTVASKSILRAAADHVTNIRENVEYFPSYEIITSPNSNYYDDNLRLIKPDGVGHVMRVFARHFIPPLATPRTSSTSLFRIVCDEESIEAAI